MRILNKVNSPKDDLSLHIRQCLLHCYVREPTGGKARLRYSEKSGTDLFSLWTARLSTFDTPADFCRDAFYELSIAGQMSPLNRLPNFFPLPGGNVAAHPCRALPKNKSVPGFSVSGFSVFRIFTSLTRIYSPSDLLVFAPKPFIDSWIEPGIHSFIAAT